MRLRLADTFNKKTVIRNIAKKCSISVKDASKLYELLTEACVEELLAQRCINMFGVINIDIVQDDISNVSINSKFSPLMIKRIRELVKQR